MSDDHCVICADALEWTGFGACGHKEACSRCVARLRFVLQDKRCMYCHAPQEAVFFTRYMGDYTARPESFESLPARAKGGDVFQLDEVGGYFDDREHYKYIKALCSYTHPALAAAGGAAPAFGSLDALKRRVRDNAKLHFCDLCLKGRKVFISEQVLYSQRDLDRHNRTGDDAGPLAEAGFKGHPPCHFCKSRFYDSNELYNHMERSHEHCFICRRNNPSKYVYFKDYPQLDAHFQSDHHPCPHPACIERRFVVFQGEAELKRHFAAEHGEELRMSRAQRREALAVPVDLQFAPRADPPRGGRGGRAGGGRGAGGDAPLAAAMERPGVVIGGGAGLAAARGGRGGGMRHSRSDPAMAAAMAASLESAGAEAASRAPPPDAAAGPGSVSFNAADFPAVGAAHAARAGGAAPAGAGVALGTWVAGSSSGAGAGGGAGAALGAEEFPELPSLSRAQKQRQKQKAKAAAESLAARMAAAAAPPRVLNRATPGAGPSAASGSASGSGGGGMAASRSAGSLDAAAQGLAARPVTPGSDAGDDPAAAAGDAFPALGGGAGAAQAHPSWVPVRTRAPRPGGRGDGAAAAPAAPRPADFPALPAAAPAGRKPGGRASGTATAAAARAAPALNPADAAAAAAARGGVSDELKAANRALVERIQSQLDSNGFASFREKSSAFMRGDLTAGDYHDLVVGLGLLSLVPQLAELCPAADRRVALLRAHKEFLQSPRAHDAASLGAGWVPPEAALAAAARAEQQVPWACAACTLVNAPGSRACEVCGAARGAAVAAVAAQERRQQQQQPQPARASTAAAVLAASLRSPPAAAAAAPSSSKPAAAAQPSAPPPPSAASWPSVGGGPGGGGGGSSSGGGAGPSQQRQAAGDTHDEDEEEEEAEPTPAAAKGKGKGKAKPVKQSLQQLLQSGRTAPGNAWSQPQRTSALGAVPAVAQPKGAWGGKAGGGDKLARQLRATGLGER